MHPEAASIALVVRLASNALRESVARLVDSSLARLISAVRPRPFQLLRLAVQDTHKARSGELADAAASPPFVPQRTLDRAVQTAAVRAIARLTTAVDDDFRARAKPPDRRPTVDARPVGLLPQSRQAATKSAIGGLAGTPSSSRLFAATTAPFRVPVPFRFSEQPTLQAAPLGSAGAAPSPRPG